MRVLVTGATGFIGRPLVTALIAAGDTVRAGVRAGPAAGLFPDGVEVVHHGDLGGGIDCTPLVAGMDAVVHLAGIAHAGPDIAAGTYDRVNHRATAALARAARAAGVGHIVFISSIRAQSGPVAPRLLTEADEAKPTDPYGLSKLAAEMALRATRVPYTVLRPVLVYGPGVKGNLAALARLAALPVPLPFGAFSNRRSLASIDAVTSAIRFALETGAANETYIVADPKPISVAQIIAALRRGFGRRPGLLPVPRTMVRRMLRLAGRREMIARLGGELVADPAKLIAAGWPPPPDTAVSLEKMARAMI